MVYDSFPFVKVKQAEFYMITKRKLNATPFKTQNNNNNIIKIYINNVASFHLYNCHKKAC